MDGLTAELLTQLIGSLGFPIFVSVYMLFKDSKDNKLVAEALGSLREAILILNAKIDKFGE